MFVCVWNNHYCEFIVMYLTGNVSEDFFLPKQYQAMLLCYIHSLLK